MMWLLQWLLQDTNVLTVTKLKNLDATGTPYRIWDGSRWPDFGVSVSAKGTVSFFQAYRQDGKRRYYTLGRWPGTKLGEARDMAEEVYKKAQRGIYPHDEKARLKAEAAAQKDPGTVKQLFDEYLNHLDGKRSHDDVEGYFEKDIKPMIGDLLAKDVTRHDVSAVLHPIVKRGALVKANRVRSYLMAAFTFGIEFDTDPKNHHRSLRFEIAYNPVRDVKRPLKAEKPATRFLSENELRTAWPLLGAVSMGTEMGNALRLMLATGQRVEECLRAEWSEFDGNHWTIPGSRTKNGRTHLVPLNTIALEVIEEMRAGKKKDDVYVFVNRSTKLPYRTDSISTATTRFCKATKIEHFTPRDLRRTVKSLMGKAGIPKEHRDRLQNHALSDVSSRHYDLYDYLAEKEAAVENWGRYLQAILSGEEQKVVTFPRVG